jgi:hypothetical protein
MEPKQLSQFKEFIELCKSNPAVLQLPQLGFFKVPPRLLLTPGLSPEHWCDIAFGFGFVESQARRAQAR